MSKTKVVVQNVTQEIVKLQYNALSLINLVGGINCAFWDSPSITKRRKLNLGEPIERDYFINWLSERSGTAVSLLGIYSVSGKFKNLKVMDFGDFATQQEE